MTGLVELALCGSNVTGDVPFSCALRLPQGIVAAQSAAGARGDLAQLVADLCAAHGVAPEQVGSIRVDVGPGSYTGLRVVVTFVRFLQRFAGVTVQAIDSLALLAARALPTPLPPSGRVVAVLDARRQRVHRQAFTVRDGEVVALQPAAALPLAAVVADLRAADLVLVPETLPEALRAPLAANATVRVERALVAAEMWTPGLPFMPATAADLEPRYLMASYAED
jgi:tRNA threonylcarbamoyladenosine biosynthesis protein TsaB